MSYGIVRIQKFSSGSIKGIEIHDRREKNGVSHTNHDIDWDRTKLNYDLCDKQNENFNQAIKKRVSELNLKKAVRKDAIVMCQCLVTSDKEFFDKMSVSEQQEFFKRAYDWLCNRYGSENVISAIVHMDEKTPHMHFNFVPVTADGRLSAKSIFRYKTDLSKLHDDFHKDIGKAYGLKRGEVGQNKEHLETAEFKIKTLENKLEQLQDIAQFANYSPPYVQHETTVLSKKHYVKMPYDNFQGERSQYKGTLLKLEQAETRLKMVSRSNDNLHRKVDELEDKIIILKQEKEKLQITLQEYKEKTSSYINKLENKIRNNNEDFETIRDTLQEKNPEALEQIQTALLDKDEKKKQAEQILKEKQLAEKKKIQPQEKKLPYSETAEFINYKRGLSL